MHNDGDSAYPPPNFSAPKVPGDRYEAEVPDTLDLAERAALAINGIAGGIDRDLDHQMWFLVNYACNPATMRHHAADATCDALLAPTFALLRTMSGSTAHVDTEVGLIEHLLRDTSPDDGLYYNVYSPDKPWHSEYGHAHRGLIPEDFAVTVAQAHWLEAMIFWRELTGEPAWETRIRKMVDGLIDIAVYKGDYAYYPDGGFAEVCGYPRSGWRHTEEPEDDYNNAEGSVTSYYGDILRVLPLWYQASGDERALDLAGRLSRFCMQPRFWGGNPQTVMVAGNELGHFNFHAHNRLLILAGMVEYAHVANDARVLEFAQRGFEYAMTIGVAKLGWVTAPFWGGNHVGMNEACTFFDLLRLGVRLSDAGAGDYWDYVDAVVRNHLAEQQLLDAEVLRSIVEASPPLPEPPIPHGQSNQGVSIDNVVERTLGMFGSCATPVGIPQPWVMQCCSANAPRALYYAWEGALRHDKGTVTVNLLLNRASAWLDVDSYLPYEGKVLMHVKDAARVAVRLASWIPRDELQTRVNGIAREGVRLGNYMLIDELKPGDTIALSFPVQESVATYTGNAHRPGGSSSKVRETQYRCTFRGSTIVDVSPRDEDPTTYPFYRRDHMRQDAAPMKRVTRFVPERTIVNW